MNLALMNLAFGKPAAYTVGQSGPLLSKPVSFSAMELTIIYRFLLAAFLGGLIGVERELRAKGAGLRTHFLVAIGSALFMLVSQYGFLPALSFLTEHYQGFDFRVDLSRVASQIVSGIGFIGAGAIVLHKRFIVGLTTAASIWVTAAIGCAAAGGLVLLSVCATLLALIGLELFVVIDRFIGSAKHELNVAFLAPSEDVAQTALDALQKAGAHIAVYSGSRNGDGMRIELQLQTRAELAEPAAVLSLLMSIPGITPLSVE